MSRNATKCRHRTATECRECNFREAEAKRRHERALARMHAWNAFYALRDALGEFHIEGQRPIVSVNVLAAEQADALKRIAELEAQRASTEVPGE